MQRFSKVWSPLGDRTPSHDENRSKTLFQAIFITALVLSIRILGWLQPLELIAFDTLLKLRLPEPSDDRITLIKITQEDIEDWGGYPLPPPQIIELVEELQQHEPAVIGLNLLGDILPNDNQEIDNLFTIANLVSPETAAYFNDQYNNMTIRYGDFKMALAKDIWTFVKPFNEKIADIRNNEKLLAQVMEQGMHKAKESAHNTLNLVRDAIGLKRIY